MPAEALKLELTETSVVTDPEGVCRAMRQLQAMGVTLSVDDFGTGHASLSYLTSFPFGEVKIDQTFVGGLTTDRRCRGIVRSILSMARELDLTVVAEGVEDTRTLGLLRHLGCDRAQGYAIAKPLSEGDLLALVHRGVALGARDTA
jgi:EAL domain-containing protein (putative c-di-GMP-specific phosphodiesterase class I)